MKAKKRKKKEIYLKHTNQCDSGAKPKNTWRAADMKNRKIEILYIILILNNLKVLNKNVLIQKLSFHYKLYLKNIIKS